MLLSRQARGDSAATLYPLSLIPSPPPSLPQPSPQQILSRLAPSPFPVPSHTPEALEQSSPTLGNRYSHHHSLILSDSISLPLAQCLPGQHALLKMEYQCGENSGKGGNIWSGRWQLKLGCKIVHPCSSSTESLFCLWAHPFSNMLASLPSLIRTPHA